MLAAFAASTTAFTPQQLFVQAPAVRASTPVVMAEGQSRRAALLGLATLAVPAAASASKIPGATAIWEVGSIKTDLGPPDAAKKCNMEKPCVDGAGLKWDAKALGVKAAETRKFTKGKK